MFTMPAGVLFLRLRCFLIPLFPRADDADDADDAVVTVLHESPQISGRIGAEGFDILPPP